MSKIGVIASSILFGSMLIAGVFLFLEHEVKNDELVEFSGFISDVSCPTGKLSGKPKMTLVVNNLEKEFSLFQVFGSNLPCNGKEQERALIGSPTVLKVLPNQSEFAWAYEVYVNSQLVYGIGEARSESKITGLMPIVASIAGLLFGLFKRQKST